MFRIQSIDPELAQIQSNLKKIRSVLSQTLLSVKPKTQEEADHPPSPPRSRKQSNTQPQSIEEVLTHLKRGYPMMKHSRNTSQPHSKVVYLSNDNKHLCWKSFDKEDEKSFPIASIQQIWKRCGQPYHKKNWQRSNLSSTLMIYSTERNLELQACSQIQAQTFKYQMDRVILFSQEMNQNYKYSFEK